MKLVKMKIKNFRCYKDEITIDFSNITALIGKNDIGKSTILEALEIYFNNSLVVCEKEDLNINAENNDIEISCIFSDYPTEIIIDSTTPTNLSNEYLLNEEDFLEIKKVFTATISKPKEKIYINCIHPSINNGNDLLTLKQVDLRTRATQLEIPQENYNANINLSMRQAIWESFSDLHLKQTQLLVDKEDTKKVYESLKYYLPLFALFQSDRSSKDDDKEVTDPMKIAVQQALQELNEELENIKTQVKNKAIDTANRTLSKLQEMSPEIASELIPDFRTEPKFDSQFKLNIKSENDISINKRGSGIRRLILLNFFRAEAERKSSENQNSNIIYAFEEPETSQHPDHQEMLLKSFIELANAGNTQIILTTHTPAIAGLLPLESLRFLDVDGTNRIVEIGSEEVFKKIVDTLGVIPEPFSSNTKALLLVEGKGDVIFVKHMATQLKNAGYISHDFEEKGFAIIPIGGCGNLKYWSTLKLASQFNVPWCILIDSDKGTNEETKNISSIHNLRNDGIKAYCTRKREPENYIHYNCFGLPVGTIVYNETDDAKKIINSITRTRSSDILDIFWPLMTIEQIREVEEYSENGDTHYEFTEMFTDFLSLV